MSATVETGWKKVCDAVEVPVLTRCCLCFPLRKGLIGFAYLNLAITVVVTVCLTLFIASVSHAAEAPDTPPGVVRMIADASFMLVDLVMNVVFIVALHRKHVVLMKVYLYFSIVFAVFGFIYSVCFISKETAGELFLMLLQLTLQIYLAILVWSSIVKMERDGAVKYTRERENV